MRLEALEHRTLLSLTVIKDINPMPLFPAQITGAGANVYFVTTAADGGAALDVKTAGGTTLLKEFSSANDSLSDLTPDGSKLFFVADVGKGDQLWMTDGTRAGTRPVTDQSPGAFFSDLTVVGKELYFTDTVAGLDVANLLYRSNGTSAGTVVVSLPPGDAKSGNDPYDLVDYDNALYFDLGDRLIKADGAVTEVVWTYGPPDMHKNDTGAVANLTVAGGLLYYTVTPQSGQSEALYATNGTARGTRLVKDFANDTSPAGSIVADLTPVGSELLLVADDAASGPSLWVSNGTPAGTTLVAALGGSSSAGAADPGATSPPILTATAAGTRLFFTTEPSGPGTPVELWVSDGTAAGTTQLADIDPGNAVSYSTMASEFAAIGGTLYFANDDPTHGVEVWSSDGTAAGTGLFLDLNPGPAGSFPGNMAVIDNTLYFSAVTASGSSALWSSNGTAAGTKVVASFGSQPEGDGLFPDIPDAFAVLGNSMLFAADDGSNQVELWKTDGTAAGTTMVQDLSPSPLAYSPADFTTVGGQVFFITQTATTTLWVTDGTTAGTTRVTTFDGDLYDLTAFDGKLAFIESTSDGTQSSLWLSDGTASGTALVADIPTQNENDGVETPTMAALDGKLYISAPPLPGPNVMGFATLWVSDGTAAGTAPIPGVPISANVDQMAVYQGKLYFTVDFPRPQLWVTDGTATGTRMVANVGPQFAGIDQLLVAGPILYIFHGSGLWNLNETLYRSNGTAQETVPIHWFASGDLVAAAGLPDGNIAFDLLARSSNSYPQLWVSDGTAAGTQQVKDIHGGFGYLGDDGESEGAITPIGGLLYLQGTDSQDGTELWQSNGTVAGTRLVQDIHPAAGLSYAMALTELNGNLIVAADEGVHGLELLSGPIPAAPAAAAIRKASRR
jgi:ELWxxDGT repeat protein